MRYLLIAAVLLTGCYERLPTPTYFPNGDDREWIEHARDVWEAREDLPSVRTPECDDAALHFRIAHVDDEQFRGTCDAYCEPGHCPGLRASNACPFACAGECYVRVGRGDRWRVAVVHDSEDLVKASRHAVLHLLEDCSGLVRGGDYYHATEAVWGKGGVRDELLGRGGEP